MFILFAVIRSRVFSVLFSVYALAYAHSLFTDQGPK
jgi:hypothetical protein